MSKFFCFIGCFFFFLTVTNESKLLRNFDDDMVKNISRNELAALTDLVQLGALWRRSHYVTFCENPLAPRSPIDCELKGLKFNATSCFCYKSDSNATKSRSRNHSILPLLPSTVGLWSVDWDSFVSDAVLYGLYEAACDVQLGLIVTPQPPDLSYLRYPYAFLGPVCLGFSLFGTRCVPSKTTKMFQEVDKLMFMTGDGRYHSVANEKIDFELANSCVEKCALDSTSCRRNQNFDKNSCTCRCVKQDRKCNGASFWNPSTCECECRTSPDACGAGTRFDTTLCLCVPDDDSNSILIRNLPIVSFAINEETYLLDNKSNCNALVVCFNSSVVIPTFDHSSGTCICPILSNSGDDDYCHEIPCDNAGDQTSAIFDNNRHGCVCPCENVFEYSALPNKSPLKICPHHRSNIS